jgi:putative dehydrogenase
MAATLLPSIGMLGLGNLGLPCAASLLAAGYTVYGYRRGSMENFSNLGGVPCASAAKLAGKCDVIIDLLPGVQALEECIWGERGILAGVRQGQVMWNLASYPLDVKQRVADALSAKGVAMVEGAVSGPPEMMAKRQASLFIAGDQAVVAGLQGVIDSVSTSSFYLGGFGAALKMKIVANLLVAVHNAAAAEALSLGMKAGIDGETLHRIISASAASSVVFNYKSPKMIKRDFLPASGAFTSLEKHLELARALSADVKSGTPLLNVARGYYEHAWTLGREKEDIAALVDWIGAGITG